MTTLARLVIPDKTMAFSRAVGETTEQVIVLTPQHLIGGGVPQYGQNISWAVIRKWPASPPTLRQLLHACPLLKPVNAENGLDEYLSDKPVFTFGTSFVATKTLGGWSAQIAATYQPQVEAVLTRSGFEDDGHPMPIHPPSKPDVIMQHTWQRKSDWCFVSIIPVDDRIQVGYQSPQRTR